MSLAPARVSGTALSSALWPANSDSRTANGSLLPFPAARSNRHRSRATPLLADQHSRIATPPSTALTPLPLRAPRLDSAAARPLHGVGSFCSAGLVVKNADDQNELSALGRELGTASEPLAAWARRCTRRG